MDTLLLICAILLASGFAGIYKVEEAVSKNNYRKVFGADFAFLSTKGYMPMMVFLFLSPFLFWVEWAYIALVFILGLALLRFFFWVLVNTYRGKYHDAAHQATSNFTMLESFAGPLGALLVYGVANYYIDGAVSIIWYILTPCIGLFLLWALRSKEQPISRQMLCIIALQALLVAAEVVIILSIENTQLVVINIPAFLDSTLIDTPMAIFLAIIAVSSLFSGFYFLPEVVLDARKGLMAKGFKVGVTAAIHDVIYFVSFFYFGPIFLIARRGLLVPIQNLYINVKTGSQLGELIKRVYKEPLLSLKGGKDFIISFTDLAFNRLVKVIIHLL